MLLYFLNVKDEGGVKFHQLHLWFQHS